MDTATLDSTLSLDTGSDPEQLEGEDSEENESGSGGGRTIMKKPLREQDRFLPIANVARIMKLSIPRTGKIAKDAKECVQECVSEFVSFITSEASDRCHQEKRKTINGEDILFAMQTLGFDNYVEPLKVYLSKYREAMKGEKGAGMPGGSDGGAVGTGLDDLSSDSFNAQQTLTGIIDDGGPSVLYTYGTQQIPAALSATMPQLQPFPFQTSSPN